MRTMILVGLGSLALAAGCGEPAPARREMTMADGTNLRSLRPTWKTGESWEVICALPEQDPEPMAAPSPAELPTATEVQSRRKARAMLVASGKLPPAKLETRGGHVLWRKYRMAVVAVTEGRATLQGVSVSWTGYHGVPEAVLKEQGLRVPSPPQEVLLYVFRPDGALARIEDRRGGGTLAVDGEPALPGWGDPPFPGGFPSFRAPVVDAGPSPRPGACSQVAEAPARGACVRLSRLIGDIRPPSDRPGSRFEVQTWLPGDRWWSEATAVQDGEVHATAKMLR